MDTDNKSLGRLIFLILLEEFFLLPVQLQMSPMSTVQSKTRNDTMKTTKNSPKIPLFTLKQFDSFEERFDLTTKRSTKLRLLTMPPQIDEKTIGVGDDGRMTPPSKLNVRTATDSSDFEGPIMVELSNIFTGIGDESWTLEEKIIRVEEKVCRSGCGSLRSTPYFPKVPNSCHSCHCDHTCITYHTCCPDLLLRKQVSYDGLGSGCVYLKATGVNVSDINNLNSNSKELFSSMITKCHASTNGIISTNSHNAKDKAQEDIQRSKCERPDISKPDELFPVTDLKTEVTYRNKPCAKCNNIEEVDLTTWEGEIVCDGNFDLLLESNPNKTELYRMLTTKEEVERTGCHMTYLTRQKDFRRTCRYPLHPIIESCNETGHWPQSNYNVDIERACHLPSYSSIFMNKYKNMFCFLCNTGTSYDSTAFAKLVGTPPEVNVARVSFSALVDFSDVGDEVDVAKSETLICHESQFYDNLTCSCRDIKCSEGKEFIRDENACESYVLSNALGYRACARVELQVYGATMLEDFDRFYRKLYLFPPSYEWKVTVSRWCPGFRNFTIHLEISEFQFNTFGPVKDIEKKLEGIKVHFCETINNKTVFGQMVACTVKYVEKCPDFQGHSLPCEIDTTVRVPQKRRIENVPGNFNTMSKKTTFIPYFGTNRCAFVEIPVSEFNKSGAMLTHFASGQRIYISKADFIENDTKIRLCLDDYLQWTQGNASGCGKDQEDDDSFDTWTTAGLISIICSCISLLFLFLTFVTYMLFDQLRSGGGKNIMVLTVMLFIAQALYEFAIEQYENEYLCSAIGISIHFFWLAAVFSMNACTWERFCKLCFPLKSRSYFMSRKSFLIATAYTFSCPLLIVVCNISANVATKQHVGYGNSRLCYINERYSRIFSFVVPLCAIVVVNTSLFIFTICKLRRKALPGDRKTSQTRIGLVACVRLSVVTGVTWLVSLLYEAVPVQAMGYIFTVLLGLQGVVFFFSVVVNKRVIEMYRKRFSFRSKPHSSSGSGTKETALLKKNEETGNKKSHDVVMQGHNSTSLGAGHTDLSRLCSGDSGVDCCEVEAKKEQEL